MASFWYDQALLKLVKADADFDTLDVRALLVMTNTTADTERDKSTLSGFTTLDEFNGSGYSRPDLTMVAPAVNLTTHVAWMDAADFTFGTTVGAGTRSVQAMILYNRVDGTNTNDWPIAFVDTGGFPFAPSGGPVNVTVDVAGLLQVAA